MAHATGTVTEVGVGNIQFYIPSSVSTDADCLFDPNDEFRVQTIAGVGLLLLRVDCSPTLPDLVRGLDTIETDAPIPTIELTPHDRERTSSR